MRIDSKEVRKILAVKLGGLGDVILSTIIIESLQQYFPGALIDYFVEKAGEQAIAHNPNINSVFVLDKKTMSPLSVISEIRKRQYDIVFDLFGNPRSAIITFLSGAKHRVGLDYGWRKHLYTITGKARRGELHGAEVNLQALVALGMKPVHSKLQFPLTSDDQAYAEEFWKLHYLTGKTVVGILPAGSWQSKRCEPSKYAEILSVLSNRYELTPLIIWGPTDEHDAKEIQRQSKVPVILGRKASLPQNIALLSRCTVIIANDSGPMHIASSFNVPILCIYGPTFPEGPYGSVHSWVRNEELNCLVCNLLTCPIQHQCMTELSAEHVAAIFHQMLEKNNIRFQKK